MTDGNDIIVDCYSGHDEVCKGESYKDSYTDKTDFQKQAEICSVKSSEEVEESANEEGKASKARALAAGINETEGSVAVHQWDDSDLSKERINNTDKLKNHGTADSFAESIRSITEQQGVEETGEAQDRVNWRPDPPDDFFTDQKEKHFKDDVQNHLTWIKEAMDHILAEESPSSNFLKLCEMMRDDHRKVMDPILYDGYDLKNKGRDVGAYIDKVRMEFDTFSSTVESLQPTINNFVNPISRGDSPQSKTELIEERFGTKVGVHKITHQGYICIYNLERRLGITYEYLTNDNFSGSAERKTSFKRVEDNFCTTCKDFKMKGFHKGHLAASGNYKNSQDQRNDTFYLTNVVPQNNESNTEWHKIELYTQDLLDKHNKEGLLVITGWLMMETSSQNGQLAYVTHRKHKKISVPTHLFKVVITEFENSPEGLAVFIVPNDTIEGSSYDDAPSAHGRLKMIEEHHGYILAPKIDKSKLCDLSDHFKVNKKSNIEYKEFITNKKRESAKSKEKLDRVNNKS